MNMMKIMIMMNIIWNWD